MTTQRKLTFFQELPPGLAQIETAMKWLSLREDGVLDLIYTGHLVAFNLARCGVKTRFPCIWVHSISLCAEPGHRGMIASPWSTDDVLSDILPKGHRHLRGGELMDILSIKSALLHRHLKDGELLVEQSLARKPGRSPLIRRASVVEFLERRRM